MEEDLMLYANFYYNLGMNVTHILGNSFDERSYKRPTDPKWDKHDIEYIYAQDWSQATGVGVMLGYNQYRAIDIDQLFISFQPDLFSKEEWEHKVADFVRTCLSLLGLPTDYQWVVKSGSSTGCHIIIKSEDVQGFDIDSIAYSPGSKLRGNDILEHSGGADADCFLRMELRWWNAHLVLPPSINAYGGKYEFYFKKIPTYAPLMVSIDNLNNLLDYFCGDDEYIKCNYKGRDMYLAKRKKNGEKFSSTLSPVMTRIYQILNDDFNWLLKCHSNNALNSLGVSYCLGKGISADISKAKSYFEQANNSHAHFNLANLIASGCIDGDMEEVNKHLSFCQEIPKEYTVLVKTNAMETLSKRKPYYLFFDIETTGLPANYNAPISDLKNWPRLVQIAWIVYDEKGAVVKSAEYIIKPNGFIIPKDAILLHRISTERATIEGKDIKEVLTLFAKLVRQSKFLVGHNVSFDINIVGAEFIRAKMECVVQNKSSICTMKGSIDFCRIPGKYGYKFPTLDELHFKLFNSHFAEAHNAFIDIQATAKCFWELKKRNIIIIR